MNVIQVLTNDHKKIKDLFSQFEDSGERAHKQKQTIAEKVIQEISAHSQAEERVFYSALKERGDKEMQKKVLEGIEEHRTAEFMMERLAQTGPEEETFEARFKVLTELVKEHIKEEEQEVFPKAKKLLEEDQEEMGIELQGLEQQLKA